MDVLIKVGCKSDETRPLLVFPESLDSLPEAKEDFAVLCATATVNYVAPGTTIETRPIIYASTEVDDYEALAALK